MNQLTTAIRQLVESDDPTHAERWYWACANLIKPDQCVDASHLHEALIQRKREPRIGKTTEDELAAVRGALWRHVMAYSGLELLAKSVLWDGKSAHCAIHLAFGRLLNSEISFQPF